MTRDELYLWVIPFKIDGENIFLDLDTVETTQLNGAVNVISDPPFGEEVVYANIGGPFSKGEYRTLNASDYPISSYRGKLFPIPVIYADTGEIDANLELPGIFGCLVIMLERDFTDKSLIRKAYTSLVETLETEINNILPTIGFEKQELSETDISNLTDRVVQSVTGVMVRGTLKKLLVNIFTTLLFPNPVSGANIALTLDTDDFIGGHLFLYDTSHLKNLSNPLRENVRENAFQVFNDKGKLTTDYEIEVEMKKLESARCFIVTAAYGADYSNELSIYRNWRDNLVKTSTFGKSIVNMYYKLSPPFANIIRRSVKMRRVARAVLTPISRIIYSKNPNWNQYRE